MRWLWQRLRREAGNWDRVGEWDGLVIVGPGLGMGSCSLRDSAVAPTCCRRRSLDSVVGRSQVGEDVRVTMKEAAAAAGVAGVAVVGDGEGVPSTALGALRSLFWP